MLAQLTGDPASSTGSRAGSRSFPTRPSSGAPPTRTPLTSWSTRWSTALAEPAPRRRSAVDDPELFARLAPLALGSDVGDEYIGLLLEQGGFQPSQPVLPRTATFPTRFKVAIIGAGHRRDGTRRWNAPRPGSATRSSTATTRSAAPGTRPTTPASASTPRRRTTHCPEK